MKDHTNGQKVSALVLKYGLPQSTISTIICSASKLSESSCSGMANGLRESVWQGAHKVEEALFEWFLGACEMNIPITYFRCIFYVTHSPLQCVSNEGM